MKPLYQKIIDILREEIENLEPNAPILSERELEKKYNASRMTVRKAVSALVESGELYRIQNVGTFVADQKLKKKGNSSIALDSFCLEKEYKIIYFDVKEDDKIVCENLEIGHREKYIRIVRLNMKNTQEVESIEEIYIVHKMIDKKDLNNIHNIFEFGANLETGSINQVFIPMNVPIVFANLLQVKVNTPIICVDTKVITLDGHVFAFIKKYLHPDTHIEITV